MKILIVIDYFQPQLGYSENFFSKEFVKAGNTVWILTSNYYFPFPDYDKTMKGTLGPRKTKIGEQNLDGIKVIRKKLLFEIFARAVFGGHEEILQIFNPDMVLVNKSAGFSAVKLTLLKDKYNFKLFCYDSLLLSELTRGNVLIKKFCYFLFKLFFAGLLNSKVDKFISVQEGTIRVMQKYFGIKKKIDLIPLGTDIKLFRFDKIEKEKLRKKYLIKEDDFVVLYAGKVIESKGVHLLYQALDLLWQKYKNIKLAIVGEGTKDYLNTCFSYIDKKFLNNVVMIPFQPVHELYKFYSMADCAVWPLQDSTSMNDAASCSLPFIANDTLGDKLKISNGNALLYKKNDFYDLAKKIEYLFQNHEIRAQMGKKGRRLAESKLDWAKLAKQYLTI